MTPSVKSWFSHGHRVLLLLIVCFLLAPPPAFSGCARKKGEVEVSVPILFVTDRARIKTHEPEGIDFGKQVVDPIDTLTYGVVRRSSRCRTPEVRNLAQLKALGWHITSAETAGADHESAHAIPVRSSKNGSGNTIEASSSNTKLDSDSAPTKAKSGDDAIIQSVVRSELEADIAADSGESGTVAPILPPEHLKNAAIGSLSHAILPSGGIFLHTNDLPDLSTSEPLVSLEDNLFELDNLDSLGHAHLFDESKVFGVNRFDKLTDQLQEALEKQKVERPSFVIYVHGCCVDFDCSMKQAADLASSVKVPVVAYSWGSSMGYAGSIMAAPRTQERFNTFIVRLLRRFPDAKIGLVGNSLGNSVVLNYCLQRRAKDSGRALDTIFLSRADVDAASLKSQISHLKQHSEKIVLFVAKNDFQINLSGTLRWFFFPTQHGERVGHSRAMLQKEDALTVIDVSPLKMGHLIPYDALADLFENDGNVPGRSKQYRFERKDGNLYQVELRDRESSHTAAEHQALSLFSLKRCSCR